MTNCMFLNITSYVYNYTHIMYTKGKGFQPRPVGDTSRRRQKKPAPASESASAAAAVAARGGDDMSDDFDAIAASMVPDYGFPIVYYLITHAEFTNHQLNSLNTYINIQTNVCNRRPGDPTAHAFLSSPNEICVLFMYWDSSHHLDVLKTTDMGAFHASLSDLNFLNRRILGHAKIAKNFPYLSIYNFCKHSVTIAPDAVTQRTPQFGPIGIAMFNALLTAATFIQAPAPAIDVAADAVVDAAGAGGAAVVVDAAVAGGAAVVVDAAVAGDAAVDAANTLWLGIDVNNPDFSKVARIYTVCGFSNPVITNIDVTGVRLPFNTLQLTRPLHAHASSHLVSVQNYNQTMNLMHKWHASTQPLPQNEFWARIGTSEVTNLVGANARIMKYKFSFDRSCILSLHLFPFVSFNERGLATGLTQMHGQRETSGKFVVTQSLYDQRTPAEGRDVLALETTVVSPSNIRLNFNVGNVDSVQMFLAEATFHTHPIANYKTYKTIIGPPSGGDFLAFVQSFVNLQLTVDQSFKFSLVSTIEGVHIISLTPAGIIFFINLMRDSQREAAAEMPPADAFALFTSKVEAITQHYEYRFTEREFVWEEHGIDEARSQEALHAVIDKYTEWFIRVNGENGNCFEWTWTPWDEFNVDDITEVYYLENRIRIAQ
jgi:hypothetical protein